MFEEHKANRPKSIFWKIPARIVRNRRTLRNMVFRLTSLLPRKAVMSWRYRLVTGRFPNLKNPQRLTEKIQWYKINYHDPLMTKCVDKYLVRDYVREKGLAHILNELYFVCDTVSELDFDKLPNEFVLKTTNSSGTNIFCRDKTKLDVKRVKKQIGLFIKQGHFDINGEWAYRGVKNRIIVERLRTDPSTKDGGLNDYKFFCFDGKVVFFAVDTGRFSVHYRNYYNSKGEFLNVYSEYSSCRENTADPPQNLSNMISIAERLADGFPFVRVDLYNIRGEIMFGEMTFYPWGGEVRFTPDSFDFEMGEKFVLPDVRK